MVLAIILAVVVFPGGMKIRVSESGDGGDGSDDGGEK